MGSVSVSSCIIMFYVHPAAVLNVAFVNSGRGCKRPPCSGFQTRQSVTGITNSCANGVETSRPCIGARFTVFGQSGHADLV